MSKAKTKIKLTFEFSDEEVGAVQHHFGFPEKPKLFTLEAWMRSTLRNALSDMIHDLELATQLGDNDEEP